MTIYLVRHAKAGSRRGWSADDDLRPLATAGHRQAESIADALVDAGVQQLVSSPFVRCRQTLDPLAQRLRLPLELSDALAEGASLTDTLRLLEKVTAETAALCTHGDVVANVIGHLERAGVPIDDERLEKGSIWVLDTRDGDIFGAHYLPPRAA
ncbi:MAG: phosphoglycerate mutase family protein [Acidimicrobiia bacterium]